MMNNRPPILISPGLYNVQRLAPCELEDVVGNQQVNDMGKRTWASDDGTLYNTTQDARVAHPEKPSTILQPAHFFDLTSVSPEAVALQAVIDAHHGQSPAQQTPKDYFKRIGEEMQKQAGWIADFVEHGGLQLFVRVCFNDVSRMVPLVGLTLTNLKGEAPTTIENLLVRPVIDGRPGGRVWVQGKKYPDLYVPVKKK
jgi:hypothetical protein